MKCFAYVLFIFFLGVSTSVEAQRSAQRKGDVAFEAQSYSRAQKFYLRAVKRGSEDAAVLERLADAFYFTGDYKNAAKWYESLTSKHESVDPTYFYRYALSLKSTEQYAKSDEVMMQFKERASATDKRAALFDSDKEYLARIEALSGKYEVRLAMFSSNSSEFAPSFYRNEVVYASNGEENKIVKSNHTWNNQPLFDLFTAKITDKGKLKSIRFKGDINTRYHESTTVFTKDFNTLYFTRNNFTDGWYKQDGSGINRLKLYKATRIKNNRWEITELPFNSDAYSIGHPALSPDEKTLYFASDMPGGEGMSDLYKVSIEGDTYGDPVNLGKDINTEARDTFPFISKDHKLYFASDGRPGLGGLDIFVVNISEENTEVTNLGAPVNSPKDDFTFIINSETNEGYFASNRENGAGDDDIYKVIRVKE